jgi:hypothetical protein
MSGQPTQHGMQTRRSLISLFFVSLHATKMPQIIWTSLTIKISEQQIVVRLAGSCCRIQHCEHGFNFAMVALLEDCCIIYYLLCWCFLKIIFYLKEGISNKNNNYVDGKERAYIEKIEQFTDIVWLSGAGSCMTFFDFSVYTGGWPEAKNHVRRTSQSYMYDRKKAR